MRTANLSGASGRRVLSAPVAAVLNELRPTVEAALVELLALPAPNHRLLRMMNSYFAQEESTHPHGQATYAKRCPFGSGRHGQTEHDPKAIVDLKAYVAGTTLEQLRVGAESKAAVRSRLQTQVGIAVRRLYRAYPTPAAKDLTEEQDRRSASLAVERLMKNPTVKGVQVATARGVGARFALTVPKRTEEPSQ